MTRRTIAVGFIFFILISAAYLAYRWSEHGFERLEWFLAAGVFFCSLYLIAVQIAGKRHLFKDADGEVDRIVCVLDGITKVVTVGGVFVALYLFVLYEESTESMNLTVECQPMQSAEKKYLEITVKVENVGKVRVKLVAGFLRLQRADAAPANTLNFRLIPDPLRGIPQPMKDFWEDGLILSGHLKNYHYPKKYELPPGSLLDKPPAMPEIVGKNNDESLKNEMFFDPGESHVMRYLVEYQGTGIAIVTSRFDGNKLGYYWYTSRYVRLPPDTKQ